MKSSLSEARKVYEERFSLDFNIKGKMCRPNLQALHLSKRVV